jgi:citrate lyase alpha subunit
MALYADVASVVESIVESGLVDGQALSAHDHVRFGA